ncbi:MAG: FAD:protein FMN transferase, partial [Butyricicoccaceae bacterium]
MKKIITAALLAGLCLTGCAQKEYQTSFYAMDTFMSITAYGSQAEQAVTEANQYINALESKISRTRENSEVSELAKGDAVTLSDDTAQLLRTALEMAEQTEGRFDPTVAALSDLWQIGKEGQHIPEEAEIAQALRTVGYQNIRMDGNTAQLSGSAKLDLGGIGKGYAADRTADILRENCVERAVIALGGNIYVLGSKSKDEGWKIGITDPDKEEEYVAALEVSDISVVTTGDYERYFEQDGKRYHHVFDPETGYPADTDLRSVTVVREQSAEADALSTALFVMGYEQAVQYCEEHDIAAVFIRNDHTIRTSTALEKCAE